MIKPNQFDLPRCDATINAGILVSLWRMAPTKKNAKTNVESSKHDIISFFGTARARGSPKLEDEPKESLTKVESEGKQGGKATPKSKCAIF